MEKQHMGPSFSTIPSEAVPNSVAIHMARPLAHCQCLKVETAHQGPIGNSEKNRIFKPVAWEMWIPIHVFLYCSVNSRGLFRIRSMCRLLLFSDWLRFFPLNCEQQVESGGQDHKFRISNFWDYNSWRWDYGSLSTVHCHIYETLELLLN